MATLNVSSTMLVHKEGHENISLELCELTKCLFMLFNVSHFGRLSTNVRRSIYARAVTFTASLLTTFTDDVNQSTCLYGTFMNEISL